MSSATFTDAQTFRALVVDVATRAKEKLPESINGRLEGAVKLVLAHDITLLDDGSIEVGSCTDPLKTYRLEGTTCTCQDFPRAPGGWCRHRIAAGIDKRVRERLAAQAPQPPAPAPEPPELVSGIDPRWLVRIQGRPFIRFEGLLSLAHEKGLVELSTTVVMVTEMMAVCQAVARFKDGLVVTDIGDATPTNVKAHLKPHFVRMAATRASARALRRALDIDACSVEELGDD